MGAALRLLNLDETSFETCFSPVRNRTKYGYVFNDSVNYIDPSGKNGFLWVGGGLLFGGLLGYKYVLKPLIDTFENPPPNSEPDPNPSSCPSSKPSGTKKDNLFLPPSDPLNE